MEYWFDGPPSELDLWRVLFGIGRCIVIDRCCPERTTFGGSIGGMISEFAKSLGVPGRSCC